MTKIRICGKVVVLHVFLSNDQKLKHSQDETYSKDENIRWLKYFFKKSNM